MDSFGKPLIFRGAQPFKNSHYEALKKLEIKNIIIFKSEKDNSVSDEMFKLVEYGFELKNIYHIPMKWRNFESFNEACEDTKKALIVLENSYQNNEKTFFHCTAGQDRTGFLDALFHLLINPSVSLKEVFQNRMCQYGYANADLKKPAFISTALDQELTIFFELIGQQIINLSENRQSIKSLNCQLEYNDIKIFKPMNCRN